MPNHLPEAEPILPGHTLLRPALGMLKSSVKFPHRDQEDGAGVYGNDYTIGMKYGGRNERVLYSGFRRTPKNYLMDENKNEYYLMRDIKKRKRSRNSPKRNFSTISKILQFVYGILENASPKKMLRFGTKKTLRNDFDNDDDLSMEDDVAVKDSMEIKNQDVSKSDESERNPKHKLFWNSQNMFNHIKIPLDAPDISEFMPVNISNKIRNWWFYHQTNKTD
ncbi:hypothetical protein ABMA27_011517 [Loxostege sticticalis]|uniref:Uncharacterized protein n=1 Tax=Loxostege sticticalis TaxID=481309 RepID=A0ABR3IGI1_LOXSC